MSHENTAGRRPQYSMRSSGPRVHRRCRCSVCMDAESRAFVPHAGLFGFFHSDDIERCETRPYFAIRKPRGVTTGLWQKRRYNWAVWENMTRHTPPSYDPCVCTAASFRKSVARWPCVDCWQLLLLAIASWVLIATGLTSWRPCWPNILVLVSCAELVSWLLFFPGCSRTSPPHKKNLGKVQG